MGRVITGLFFLVLNGIATAALLAQGKYAGIVNLVAAVGIAFVLGLIVEREYL